MTVTLVLLSILLFAVMVVVVCYNRLVRLRNTVEEAWSSVKVHLKQRHDLILNLVETVKGYMDYEKEVLEEITRLRTETEKLETPEKATEMEAKLTSLLGKVGLSPVNIKATFENYPELKASKTFVELQEALQKVEEQIQQARRYYNAVVRDYNNVVETFPSSIVAKLFGFTRQSYFDFPEEELENVKVSF